MNMGKMIDLKREKPEKHDVPAPYAPDYPFGMCVCLDDETLKKLKIDEVPEYGDTLHFSAIARVTHAAEGDSGKRIELQIVEMAVAGADEKRDPEEKAKSRYSDDDDAGED